MEMSFWGGLPTTYHGPSAVVPLAQAVLRYVRPRASSGRRARPAPYRLLPQGAAAPVPAPKNFFAKKFFKQQPGASIRLCQPIPGLIRVSVCLWLMQPECKWDQDFKS